MGFVANRLGLAAVALSLAATPALAQQRVPTVQSVFTDCDGYGMPTREGDGMTKYATLLFLFNLPGYGTTDRVATSSAAGAVAACDAALAKLDEKHWMRRVSLLRARAIHKLENGQPAAAIADLDLAQQAAKDPTEPYYARSLGLGLDLVRAYALRWSGEQAKAEALAVTAFEQRPYNRQTAASALVAMGPAAGDDATMRALQGLARLRPTFIEALYPVAYERGRWADLIALYPTVVAAPKPAAGAPFEREWAVRTGVYVYALAASGRGADARAIIAEARALRASTPRSEPPPRLAEPVTNAADGKPAPRTDEPAAAHGGPSGDDVFDVWAAMAEWRVMIGEGRAQEALRAMVKRPPPRTRAMVDLLDALGAQLPPADRARIPSARDLETSLKTTERDGLPDQSASVLFRNLPEAETSGRLAKYKETHDTLLAAFIETPDGFRATRPDDRGVMTVRFRGVQSPMAVVEEMALLRVADMARQGPKKGIIIVERRDTHHYLNTTYYGATLRTDPQGFETELDVLLVDPAALPPGYETAGWRVLDSEAVFAALAPVYRVRDRSSSSR